MSYLDLARAALAEGEKSEISEISPPASTAEALVLELEKGWTWLDEHPNHPEAEAFCTRWIERLRQYERAYAASRPRGTT